MINSLCPKICLRRFRLALATVGRPWLRLASSRTPQTRIGGPMGRATWQSPVAEVGIYSRTRTGAKLEALLR